MDDLILFEQANISDLSTTSDDGDFVVKEGVVWRCGDYSKTHGYAQTPEELQDAVARFSGPVQNEYIHLDSKGESHLLEGEFGTTEEIKLADDGKALFAKIRVPKWFDEIIQRKYSGRLPVSAVWEKANHTFHRLGYVKRPGIEGAVVFSAAQKEIDEAKLAYFSARYPTRPQIIEEQEIMDTNKETVVAEEPKLTFSEKLKALFSVAKPEELTEAEGVLVQAKTGKTARELELEAKLAKFEQSDAEKQREAVKTDAIAFADKMVGEKKITKGSDSYEAAIALFSIAAEFDVAKPELACFSDDFKAAEFKAGDALTALFNALPEHKKEDELAGGVDPNAVALFEQEKTSVTDPKTGAIAEYSTKAAQEIIDKQNGVTPAAA